MVDPRKEGKKQNKKNPKNNPALSMDFRKLF